MERSGDDATGDANDEESGIDATIDEATGIGYESIGKYARWICRPIEYVP